MNKVVYFYIVMIFLALGSANHTGAATIAEASMGSDTPSVGKYDLSGFTEEEIKWFNTFLKGNFFADGWEDISAEILENVSDHERDQHKVRLHELGFRIGSEWCKDNEARKIDNDFLRKWGKELKETADEAPHLLTEVILRIDSELDKILN